MRILLSLIKALILIAFGFWLATVLQVPERGLEATVQELPERLLEKVRPGSGDALNQEDREELDRLIQERVGGR